MYPSAKTQQRHRRDYRGASIPSLWNASAVCHGLRRFGNAGIGICLSAFCALVGFFFFGSSELMQPTQYPNAGLAAYKSAPIVAYVPQFQNRNEGEPAVMQELASAIEPEPETVTVRDAVPLPTVQVPTVPLPTAQVPTVQPPTVQPPTAPLPTVELPKKAEKPHRKIATVSNQPRAVRESRGAARTVIDQISANNRAAGY
jgi:hypothetical protein